MQAQGDSKVNAAYRFLKEKITSGAWPVGHCLPTEHQLAAQLQCGRNTVSQAITRLVHEGLVDRRKRAGSRVIQSGAERGVNAVDLDAYAFIYPSDQHDGIWRTVRGFHLAASLRNRRVVMLSTGGEYAQEAEYLHRLAEFDVRAAVIYPIITSPREYVHLSNLIVHSPYSIVLVDQGIPRLGRPGVELDHFHASYSVTQHLCAQGCTRVGFLTNDCESTAVIERYEGYLWALEQAGLAFAPERVRQYRDQHPNFEQVLGEPTTLGRRYLREVCDVDAVVCSHDYLAHGLIKAAQEVGLEVPASLKVTGIGDLTMPPEGEIPLTTYYVPYEQMGRTAFEILDGLVQGHAPAQPRTTVRGRVITRRSTESAPGV